MADGEPRRSARLSAATVHTVPPDEHAPAERPARAQEEATAQEVQGQSLQEIYRPPLPVPPLLDEGRRGGAPVAPPPPISGPES